MVASTTAFIEGLIGTAKASATSIDFTFIATASAATSIKVESVELQSYYSSIDCSCSTKSFIVEVVVLRCPSSCLAAGTHPCYGYTASSSYQAFTIVIVGHRSFTAMAQPCCQPQDFEFEVKSSSYATALALSFNGQTFTITMRISR